MPAISKLITEREVKLIKLRYGNNESLVGVKFTTESHINKPLIKDWYRYVAEGFILAVLIGYYFVDKGYRLW